MVDYLPALSYVPGMSGQIVRIVLLVALAVGILVLSLLPESIIPVKAFMGLDKAQHWLAYCGLGILVMLTIQSARRTLVLYFALSVFSCTIYGGIIEVLQGFTGRTPDIIDFSVNFAGAACGAIIAVGAIEISRNKQRQLTDEIRDT